MKNDMISLSKKESVSALALSKFLKDRIKGQDPVIDSFLKYFESFISGLRRPSSPIYKGLFLGLPNVGKRLFVESLAEYLFGNNKCYSEISCGAFNVETVSAVPAMLARAEIDLHSLLRDKNYCVIANGQNKLREKLEKVQIELYGLCKQANDDSVNSEELKKKIGETAKRGSNFVSAINVLEAKLKKYNSESPLSIVVFSDFERSCPAMLNIIQRILKDGKVRFEGGEEVDLTNSIVIVTSTFVSQVVMEEIESLTKGRLGFEKNNEDNIKKFDKAVYDRLTDSKKIYKSSMRFTIENISLDFLSLFDRISIFRPLFKDSLKEILGLELKKFCKELKSASFPILLEVSEEVENFIVKESSDRPEFGAATLLNKFNKYIRSEVARLRNCKEIRRRDAISVMLEADKVVFSRKLRKNESASAE
ncbi:MAG: AAA family ATPase [Minisyncoccota bacterium]